MRPILIVEDEAIMRESLKDWLTDGGYEVETAEAGEEALEVMEDKEYDMAILDLRLPGKDGIEVLKEARAKNPKLKGIIITAYPSVQSAIEAIKEGAVDYLPKPVDLNNLEKLIRTVLGPVQVEIRAGGRGAVAEPAARPKPEVEDMPVTVAPEEVPIHIKLGKVHYEAGRYKEAMREFQGVIAAAPGSIETRVWIKKTLEAIEKPGAGAEGAPTQEKIKECLWMRMGMVAYRVCTNDYSCVTCEFDQMMQEKMAAGGGGDLDAALEKLKALPGGQRLCRYAVKGDVSYRVCSRLFQCATCEFGQMMDEAFQQRLARLAARREALRKRDQKASTKA